MKTTVKFRLKTEIFKSDLKRKQLKSDKKSAQNTLIQFQFSEKYKTEICKNFEQTKTCKFGNHCCFAHGENELRTKTVSNELYKTKICRHFKEAGFCPYGQRCQYFHFQSDKVYFEILDSLMNKINSNRLSSSSNLEQILVKIENL